MNAQEFKRTAGQLEQAGETRRERDALAELDRIKREKLESQRFFTWWRFLDYNPSAEKFLDKLDMVGSEEETLVDNS